MVGIRELQGTHKERKIAQPRVFRGAISAHFVHAQGLRAQENSLHGELKPQNNTNYKN